MICKFHRTGFIKLEINIQIPDCTSDWCRLFHIFYLFKILNKEEDEEINKFEFAVCV